MLQGRIPKIVLAVLFGALLLSPLVIRRLSRRSISGSDAARTSANKDAALARYGFHLEEVSKASGIDFTHRAPKLDAKLQHIMPQVASMGAAVSVVDYDRDGWQDLYVTNSGEDSRNCLFRNEGNGRFRDVAAEVGLADLNSYETGVSMGTVWGDYDNDGWEDVFLYRWGRPELFRNEGGQKFTRTTEQAGLPSWVNANTAIWFDYDRDGKIDLFIGGYYSEDVNLWKLRDTRMMPESFEYAQNGGRKYLFHNRGDGSFEEVSARLGINSRRWALAVGTADLRGTGYPDLFVANDYGVAELFFNEKGRGFREVGKQTGVGAAPKSGMNVAFGDIMNQGEFAIYVTNISEEGVLIQGNNLWIPKEGTSGDNLRYENFAGDMGVELGGWSFGAQFGDLNNDGVLDLYLANGYVSAQRGTNYWYDYSKIAGGNTAIISDARNWPAMEGRSLSGFQQKRLWLNDGAGRFTEVAQVAGATDTFDGRSVVLVDLWNRGVLDVVVANQGGPLLVYKNTATPDNRWIGFELEGQTSNRSAIGARVEVFWNGQRQVQEVAGGSGFCAQNQRRLHFGLGKNPEIERVEIRWPSGKMQTISQPEPGTVHHIKESA